METLDAFLSNYGYWVFFAVGFAEFVGVPIVSVPVLIGGGALVASGTLGFWGGWYPWRQAAGSPTSDGTR